MTNKQLVLKFPKQRGATAYTLADALIEAKNVDAMLSLMENARDTKFQELTRAVLEYGDVDQLTRATKLTNPVFTDEYDPKSIFTHVSLFETQLKDVKKGNRNHIEVIHSNFGDASLALLLEENTFDGIVNAVLNSGDTNFMINFAKLTLDPTNLKHHAIFKAIENKVASLGNDYGVKMLHAEEEYKSFDADDINLNF